MKSIRYTAIDLLETQERLPYSVSAVCKTLEINESTLRLSEKKGLTTSIKKLIIRIALSRFELYV